MPIPVTKSCHDECRRIGLPISPVGATLEVSGKSSSRNGCSCESGATLRESGAALRESEAPVLGDEEPEVVACGAKSKSARAEFS